MSIIFETAIEESWRQVSRRFLSSPTMRRLQGCNILRDHYASYLRETYFYTRENAQLQAMCTAFFKSAQRDMVKSFLRHASSEVGHEKLALADLDVLGYETQGLAEDEPLESTILFTAFPHYAIIHRSEISYLGYLYFLEHLPTSVGESIAKTLTDIGIPVSAMSFLREHQSVDIGHNKMMKHYISSFILSENDLYEFTYCLSVVGHSFEYMLSGAFRAADEGFSMFRRSAR
ncbi:MAG: iron-containing redox enzyme family protein [Alphaproteobacteria bacterium]